MYFGGYWINGILSYYYDDNGVIWMMSVVMMVGVWYYVVIIMKFGDIIVGFKFYVDG